MENLKVDDVSKTSNPHKVTKNYPDDYRRQGFNMNRRSSFEMESPDVCKHLDEVMVYWNKYSPVFINAGTGAGKTTFSIEFVCNMARQKKQNVLYITNREGLSNQIKDRLVEKNEGKFSVSFGYGDLTGIMRIDNVFVVTYQGAWSVLNRIEELGIGYAIMDEVHYFISDSLFADNTWELLTKMVRKLKDTVRIYLSATGWDVFDLIDSEERELAKARSVDYGIPNCIIPEYNCYQLLAKKYYARSGELTLYSFPQRERDISLIVLPCTVRDKSFVDLIEKIKAAPPREKWVVFVVSKEKGQELCEKLQRELGGKEFVSYVDAETKASETWKKLVMESRFDARVLVTTSVADCGMNIHDSDVKHIVLFTTDRTQFIQELGRKRLEEGEHINVYVPDLSLQQLTRLENHNRQYLNLIREYRASEENAAKLNTLRQRLWRKGDAQQRHIVDVEWYTGKLCINRCAEEQVKRRRVYHEDLRRDFDSGVKSPFLVNVAKWLDVPIPDFEGVLDEEEKRERAKALLQSYLGKKLDGQTKEKFVDEVGRQFTEWFGPRDGANASRDKNLGIKYPSMNKWINELKLGFTLDGGKGDDTPWYLLLAEE